jgi:hypothetical protein
LLPSSRERVDLDELSMEDFNHFFTDYSIGPALWRSSAPTSKASR